MRIAIWHNLPSGGGKRALYDQVRGLLRRGHEIEAWCPPTADRGYLPLSDLIPEQVVPLRLKVHAEAGTSLLRKLHPLEWSARLQLQAMYTHSRHCAREIENKNFDVLFAASCVILHTPPIARFTKLPSIIYLQEPNRLLYEALPELPWVATTWSRRDLVRAEFWRKALVRRLRLPGRRVLAREEVASAKAFNRILVNSYFSREGLLRAFGVDSKVCYLGVDTTKFMNQHKKRDEFVVCLAALLPNKNIEFLIRSLAEIPASGRPKLVLICNMVVQTYLWKIETIARQAGVDFELKYRIPDAGVIDLLNRARMMVYAPRLEPFGFAPLEANACGLPVVAVAEGGVRETIQDGINGLLVEPHPQSMARAIETLLADDELHMRLSQGGEYLVATKWSIEASIDRLETALKTELDGGRRRESAPAAAQSFVNA